MDNGNGTVTDNLTGPVWLKNANCTDTVGGINKSGERLSWANALTWTNALASGKCGLSDGSTAGQWRLPNVNELESLIHAGQSNISEWLNGQGFNNVQSNNYWSSTTGADQTERALVVLMSVGSMFLDTKLGRLYVRPVR